MTERDDECELGYWLGKPFWGQGIIPEAAREMLRHAFEDIGMQKVWCGYYDGNLKSKRVQEKCGFRYQWTTEGVDVPLMHETRTGHVNLMTKDDWLWRKLYEAARSVQNGRKISDYVEAGGVADGRRRRTKVVIQQAEPMRLIDVLAPIIMSNSEKLLC